MVWTLRRDYMHTDIVAWHGRYTYIIIIQQFWRDVFIYEWLLGGGGVTNYTRSSTSLYAYVHAIIIILIQSSVLMKYPGVWLAIEVYIHTASSLKNIRLLEAIDAHIIQKNTYIVKFRDRIGCRTSDLLQMRLLFLDTIQRWRYLWSLCCIVACDQVIVHFIQLSGNNK